MMRTVPSQRADLEHLPGATLVLRGLEDVERGAPTPEAALVCVARGRLDGLGLSFVAPRCDEDWELVLYRRLGASPTAADPFVAYSAYLEDLDAFLDALDHQRSAESARPGATRAGAPHPNGSSTP